MLPLHQAEPDCSSYIFNQLVTVLLFYEVLVCVRCRCPLSLSVVVVRLRRRVLLCDRRESLAHLSPRRLASTLIKSGAIVAAPLINEVVLKTLDESVRRFFSGKGGGEGSFFSFWFRWSGEYSHHSWLIGFVYSRVIVYCLLGSGP